MVESLKTELDSIKASHPDEAKEIASAVEKAVAHASKPSGERKKSMLAFSEGSERCRRNCQGHCVRYPDECGFNRKVRCRIGLGSSGSVRLKSLKLSRTLPASLVIW